MNLEILIKNRHHLKVVHHIPGRIRIKFTTGLLRLPEIEKLFRSPSPAALKKPVISELTPLLSGKTVCPTMLPGIKSVRLNLLGQDSFYTDHFHLHPCRPGFIETCFPGGIGTCR